MKKIIFSLIIAFFYLTVFGQKVKEHQLNTKIDKLRIYLVGAEATRIKKVKLEKGRNLLVFKNVSPKLNSKSIRISTDPSVSILSISSKLNYLKSDDDIPRIKQLKDSLRIINEKVGLIEDELDAYKIEKNLLQKNIHLGGANDGVDINELKQASEFYRNRIFEINKKISSLTRQSKTQVEITNRISKELKELNSSSNYVRGDIMVLVSVEQATTKEFTLKYLLSEAGWAPSYDIKTSDISKPINLIYRAKVFNNTGVDWKDISMTLSTADPSLSITQPILKPWYLNYRTYTNSYRHNKQELQGYTQNAYVADEDLLIQTEMQDKVQTGETVFTEVEVPTLNTDFEIDKTYSIPSDDKPYLVDVTEHELPASYKHFAVTKLDKGVFLLAKIAGWEELNLVEGPANIYQGGTYVGQSYVYTRNVKDTLDLSMGRDNKVLVTRTKLKDYSDKQFIGNKITETYVFELVAKNNRKQNINIEIKDQIPISQTDEIEVKVLNLSNGSHNINSGEVKWKLNLAPGESRKLQISFSIKYPKNKEIKVKQMKKMQMRKF